MELMLFLLALGLVAIAVYLYIQKRDDKADAKLRVTPNNPPNVGAWTGEDMWEFELKDSLGIVPRYDDVLTKLAKSKAAPKKTAAKKKAPAKKTAAKKVTPKKAPTTKKPRSPRS